MPGGTGTWDDEFWSFRFGPGASVQAMAFPRDKADDEDPARFLGATDRPSRAQVMRAR